MDYCYISDVGVAHIVSMTTLTELALSKTKLTDAGMHSVAGARYYMLLWLCVCVSVVCVCVCVCVSECLVCEGMFSLEDSVGSFNTTPSVTYTNSLSLFLSRFLLSFLPSVPPHNVSLSCMQFCHIFVTSA